MLSDPVELQRARDRLLQIAALHESVSTHGGRVPRIGEGDWRGSAHNVYRARVDALAADFRVADHELAEAVMIARGELLDAAG